MAAPLIAECHANFECRLADDALVDKYNFFIFEAVKAHVAKSPKHPRDAALQGRRSFHGGRQDYHPTITFPAGDGRRSVASGVHCSVISLAPRLADRRARLLDHLGVLSMFAEQIERLNTRSYALESREQIGRGSYEPGIRLRGLLIEATDLDAFARAVDLGNQQVAGVDAEIVIAVIDSPWGLACGG